MTTLQPLNLEATCPKCGHDDIGVSYHRLWPYQPGCDCFGRGRMEHMRRDCRRCHYDWAEACLADALGEGASGQDPQPPS